MWIKKENGGRYMWKYILNKNNVCDVFEKETFSPPRFHKGYVWGVEMADIKWTPKYILYDEDLDVLKLKCLIAAKDMGWSIRQII